MASPASQQAPSLRVTRKTIPNAPSVSVNRRELINPQELYQTDLPAWDRFSLVIIAGTALMVSWFLVRWLTTSWGWFTFWLVLMGATAALGGLIFKDRLKVSAKYFAFAGMALLILNILFALVPERRGVGSIVSQSSGIFPAVFQSIFLDVHFDSGHLQYSVIYFPPINW